MTWVLRALLAVGGGILVAVVTGGWSAAPAHAEPTPDPLAAAVTVSDALAPVLPAVAGAVLAPVVDAAAPVADAGPALAAVARRVGLTVEFDGHATARLAGSSGGVAGALAELLAIVARAQQEGTWERLKVCPADDCQGAFYDKSRNRSAVWCDMKICGNRQKVRSYRERHHRPHALHD